MATRGHYIPWDLVASGALASMTAPAAKVYLALLAHDNEERKVFPALPKLATETNLNRRTIMDAIAQLERLRLLTVTRQRGRSNQYLLTAIPSEVVARDVPTSHVTTSEVGTFHATTLGTPDDTGVVAHDVPLTLSNNTKQEHEAEGGPSAPVPVPPSKGSDGSEPKASTPTNKPKGQKTRKREASLSDDDLRFILSGIPAMSAYYLFGRAGLRADATGQATLCPSPTHWAPASRNTAAPEPNCPLPAFAAYCWVILQQTRAGLGLPLALPVMGRLLGTVKTLTAKMPRQHVIEHLWRVAQNWPAIQASLGRFGASLSLDEGILANTQVIAASERIARGENLTSPSAGRSAPINAGDRSYAGIF